MTTIGGNAFYGCKRITSITIPNSVTSIGYCAFRNCSGITKATIGNGVTSIEEGVFFGCERITSITIPNSVTSIGDEAFGSTGLTSVTIPNSVISIGVSSFAGCSGLTSITIPNSVTSIGDCAFSECSSLTSITSLIPVDNLFEPGIDAFYGVDKANSTLYVPYGAKETYAAIEGWNEFTNIVEIRNTYTASFTIDGEIIATKNILEGDTIVYPNVPEKEGYSFVWEGPTTMPAKDIVIEGKYTINSYTVTFIIDGEVYKSINVEYGAEIELPEIPEKEGHTFSGWSEIPETMPAEDIVVEGSFSVNSYLLTYKIDGETYATDSITYGATITPIAEPTKEGHTFSGWSEIPTTMPANDVVIEGTFSINSYTLTYKVDGEVYETMTVEYGATIEPIEAPTKEGHTFSGWSEAPITMPAHDITIEGTFSINIYTVTYTVDGETYATDSIAYGHEIILRDEPSREGHTFSGWSEAPITMPAHDIIIEGTFSINIYTVTYTVDGETYATDSIAYGHEIILRDEPSREGHTFSGWSEAPITMPANDVVIEGTFSINSYTLTYKVDGEVYETMTVEYGATIEPIEAPTKEGHTFSGWSEIPTTMPANDVVIEGTFSINSYTVTFMVDGEVYETMAVEYGAEIELPTPPEKEGYIFTGWIDVPATMPAEDIVIEGRFEVDTTGINAVTLDLEKNEVYNLKGQRITESENLTRGIYIVNGKKTFVK